MTFEIKMDDAQPNGNRVKRKHHVPSWRSLVSAIYLELFAGGAYAFSVYAPHLKSQFNFTQRQIQLVGTLGNVGMWFALPAGYSFDKAGPLPGIIIGSICTCSGYLILWAVVEGKISASLGMLSLGAVLAQNGCGGWWDGSAIPMASKNFPNDRGIVVGLLKAFFGISASVLTVFYQSFFRPDVSAFLLVLAVVLPLGSLFCLMGAQVTTSSHAFHLSQQERCRLVFLGYGLILVLVTYLTLASWYQKNKNSQTHGYILICLLTMFAALLYPIRVWEPKWLRKQSKLDKEEIYTTSEQRKLDEEDVPILHTEQSEDCTSSVQSLQPSSDAKYKDVLKDIRFWLVFICCFIGVGSGVTVINHIGNMIISLGGDKDMQDNYVVLLSVGNCLGRASAGLLSDQFRQWTPATYFLLYTLLMTSAQLLFSFQSMALVSIACLLNGISFGAYWSLVPVMLANFYGSTDFGKVYATATLASAFGSLFWSSFVASTLYEFHIEDEKSNECTGTSCYQTTFAVLGVACFFGNALAFRLKQLSSPSK